VIDGRDVRVFVAPDGNGFMRDIASWVVAAAQAAGRRASLVDDRLPRPDGAINLVVAPHEFFLLRGDSDAEIRAAARCSIPICTEQPGTPWFLLSLGFCVGSPLVVDINAAGVAAIEREGFRAHRLRLGGVAEMDRWTTLPAMPTRDVDVVFLGGSTDRRAAALSRLGPVLWDRHCELRLFTFSRPVTGDEPGVVFGREKYDLLARAKVLVNLHRGDAIGADAVHADTYFEWARMVEAMANGCVVVTEPSLGHEPLVAGEHFVETTLDGLADAVIGILDDEPRRSVIADAAHRIVMGELALPAAVAELLGLIDREQLGLAQDRIGWRERLAARRPIVRGHKPPLLPVFAPYRSHRRVAYDLMLAEIAHRRDLDRFRALLEHGDDAHVGEESTPAWSTASPEISVVVTLYNYAEVVIEALDSIAASSDVDIEIVIVDDHSSDGGLDVVRRWMSEHPGTAVLLLASAANQGLTRSRNLAIEHARSELVMVMDADNLVYPTCLRRLADALDRDPGAAFAYATLEAFGATPGLRSAQGWYPPWLCERNYIDAQAMIRRSALERHGGYRVDDTMYGWEDWDLWLRLAAAGEHGVHVPEMLGRYRTQASSMVSLTNLAADDLIADLMDRYPSLPWPGHDS
jgi:hypothetical protein